MLVEEYTMLVASYLIGYDDNGVVGHLGLDRAFPTHLEAAEFELCEREGTHGGVAYDLMVIFPYAESPRNMICLLDLPPALVSSLANGGTVPIVDFSCGRLLRCSLGQVVERCA
ncbi:MAG: hypothetical protein ACPHN3_04955 [Spongiibacter sp.]